MLFIIGKGVFVKSYMQAESHSHIIDVVIYKMFIFTRVIHEYSLKKSNRSLSGFIIMKSGPSNPFLCISPNSQITLFFFFNWQFYYFFSSTAVSRFVNLRHRLWSFLCWRLIICGFF